MLDNEDFHWMQLGSCYQFGVTSPEDDYWFDQYEKSEEVAKNVDDMCLTCPVIKFCAEYGNEQKLDGVWGGVYLQNGKVAAPKNRHKTEKTWETLESLLK